MEELCQNVLLDPYNATRYTSDELLDAYTYAVSLGWVGPRELLREEIMERLARLEDLF